MEFRKQFVRGILTQRVKCRLTDKTIRFLSREKLGQQHPFNLKCKAVLFLWQNSQQSKEKHTHTMSSQPKEQAFPQTNAQDTSSEQHAEDNICAVTINETPPVMKRYVGLENQGATCYLNTVLQILFMTEEFREAVKRYVRSNSNSTIINHIAELFECLESGERSTATTERITAELKINVHKQDDAAKCLQKILQRIQKIQKTQENKDVSEISKIFQGMMAQTTICINPAKNHDPLKQVKPFFILSISLSSEPHVHMQKCYESYFAEIFMCGEDQQGYCKDCQMKMKTKIISSLQEVPSVLVLHLERFEFDYESMCCVKNYSSVQIPPQLLVKEEEKEVVVNHTYDLYAIANHAGSLNGGHYYADIKDQNQWHRFNDSRVKKLKMYLTCDPDIKSEEAYLLLYKKRESKGPQKDSPQICNNSEDTAEPDVSSSADLIRMQDTFSVVNETENPKKHRKRSNIQSNDDPIPSKKRRDSEHDESNEQNNLNNSDSDSETAQIMPEIKSITAEHDLPTLDHLLGEMNTQPSESEINNTPEEQQDQQVLLEKSVSETTTNAAQNTADKSTVEMALIVNDTSSQYELLLSSTDQVSKQNKGSSVSLGNLRKDNQKQSRNNNETKRAVCYIVISCFSVFAFLILFIFSHYWAPHFLTLAVVVLLLSLICSLLLLARCVHKFITNRNHDSQCSRVI